MVKTHRIDIQRIHDYIFDTERSGGQIEREVGISREHISNLRREPERFLSMKLSTLKTIQDFLDKKQKT